MREGWNVPKPELIPRPTAWPAGLALGIALFAWGIIASEVILAIGLVVFVATLWGWIGEIRHER
jgi:hypothetical protein